MLAQEVLRLFQAMRLERIENLPVMEVASSAQGFGHFFVKGVEKTPEEGPKKPTPDPRRCTPPVRDDK